VAWAGSLQTSIFFVIFPRTKNVILPLWSVIPVFSRLANGKAGNFHAGGHKTALLSQFQFVNSWQEPAGRLFWPFWKECSGKICKKARWKADFFQKEAFSLSVAIFCKKKRDFPECGFFENNFSRFFPIFGLAIFFRFLWKVSKTLANYRQVFTFPSTFGPFFSFIFAIFCQFSPIFPYFLEKDASFDLF